MNMNTEKIYLNKLFSIESKGSVFYIENFKILHLCDSTGKTDRYINLKGETVEAPNWEDSTSDDEECDELIPYTTQEYTEDVDGTYGCFGVKNASGEIIVEEQYYEIDYYSSGLCAVRYKDTDWGCINDKGELVIPFQFEYPPRFNKYGIAYGNGRLIDMSGNEIEGTDFDCVEWPSEDQRYYEITLFTEEQDKLIEQCGSAPGVTTDIYDTKQRKHILRDIPECRLFVDNVDDDPDVVVAAAGLMGEYDRVWVHNEGIIICGKGEIKTVSQFNGKG